MDAGCGSIWNKNSWHWEEKNYTAQAKQFLTERLTQIKLTDEPSKAEICLYEMKSIEGAASISIRKQKLIYLYEFEITLYFKATQGADDTCMGTIKISELQFNQDDEDVDILVTCERVSGFTAAVKKSLCQGQAKGAVLEAIAELKAYLKGFEANEEKLRKDAEEREKALQNYSEAQEKTGDLKQQIFEEQKLKEVEMKKQAEELLKQQQMNAPQLVPKQVKVEGQGSVWNTNSYFWEEKSVGAWADDRLKQVLGSFKCQLLGGAAEFSIVEVKSFKGESSISIRKGKKVVCYDYNLRLRWQCAVKDSDGTLLGTLHGEYELPEVSNDIADDGEEWEVKVSFGEDAGKLRGRLELLVKKDAAKALRAAIKSQFVDELKQK